METVKIRRELDVIIKIPEYFITAEHKFQDLDDKIAQMTGYRMENHNIVFQGVCPECQIEELEAKKREVEQAKAEGRKPDKISKKL